jgi:hypothetical protein
MASKTETLHAGGFVISEASKSRSRDNAVLQTPANLLAGTVLGKTTTAGTIAAAAAAGNTGNGTITGTSVGGGAKVGVYKAVCIEPAANAGVFELEDPDGFIIGRATVAVAFTGPINFTINDGAADFVSGDLIEFTVSQLTQKYKQLAPAGTDGSQYAAAVLFADCDASAADKQCLVIARQAEVNGNELTWPGGITATQKDLAIAQLAQLGVMVR